LIPKPISVQRGIFELKVESFNPSVAKGVEAPCRQKKDQLRLQPVYFGGSSITISAGIVDINALFHSDEDFYQAAPELISRGVRIVILTNSLGSTNHPIVHSGYKKHRKKVVKMGVELFEMRDDASARGKFDTPPVQSKAFGLHAK
jgi:phosphatidylserine/phosphatidylglycerophosphate/cardiolipin synthase-like enzyme